MTLIYCEWICRLCNNTHRLAFPIVATNEAYFAIRGEEWIYKIVKIAKGTNSKKSIFVLPDTPFNLIVEAVREYANQFFTTQEKTLKVEVCLDEP